MPSDHWCWKVIPTLPDVWELSFLESHQGADNLRIALWESTLLVLIKCRKQHKKAFSPNQSEGMTWFSLPLRVLLVLRHSWTTSKTPALQIRARQHRGWAEIDLYPYGKTVLASFRCVFLITIWRLSSSYYILLFGDWIPYIMYKCVLRLTVCIHRNV